MALYRYFYYHCEPCMLEWETMKDVRTEDEHYDNCPECSKPGGKMPFATIAKGEIEEKTHGGVVSGGKVWRKYTGGKETIEHNKLEQQLRKFRRKSKNSEEFRALNSELKAKRDESKEKAKKGLVSK